MRSGALSIRVESDSAPKSLMLERDLVRKVCNFSGSCSTPVRRRPHIENPAPRGDRCGAIALPVDAPLVLIV